MAHALRIQRKEKLLSLGQYPIVSLQDARKKRDGANAALHAGKDPAAADGTFTAAIPVDTFAAAPVVQASVLAASARAHAVTRTAVSATSISGFVKRSRPLPPADQPVRAAAATSPKHAP